MPTVNYAEAEPRRSAVALGSNIGDSQTILEAAIKTLAQTPGILLEAQSRWYQTKAVGPPQPDYLNGCVTLQVECYRAVIRNFVRN